MTDLELLNLAAKAAGIDKNYPLVINDRGAHYWNPLIDDGDALRLAVKLGLVVDVDTAINLSYVGNNDLSNHSEELHNNDPYAATRRAIVRAAAAIGKEMK